MTSFFGPYAASLREPRRFAPRWSSRTNLGRFAPTQGSALWIWASPRRGPAPLLRSPQGGSAPLKPPAGSAWQSSDCLVPRHSSSTPCIHAWIMDNLTGNRLILRLIPSNCPLFTCTFHSFFYFFIFISFYHQFLTNLTNHQKWPDYWDKTCPFSLSTFWGMKIV